MKTPTIEELKKAEQYNDKIPNYKISNGEGNLHEGVIIDEQGFSSNDYNQPPPKYAAFGGDVPIKENQLVKKGNNQKNSG